MTFVKLDAGLLDSSLWAQSVRDPRILLVWTLLLLKANQEGFVNATIPGLAVQLAMPDEEVARILEGFEQPDPYSRTSDLEGKRLIREASGWRLLNYLKYRENRLASPPGLETKGYVYYAGERQRNILKIGFSVNPWARLGDLRVTNPRIELLAVERGTMALEKARHEEFRDARTDGEWFQIVPALRDLLGQLRSTSVVTTTHRTVRRRRSVAATQPQEGEVEVEGEGSPSSVEAPCDPPPAGGGWTDPANHTHHFRDEAQAARHVFDHWRHRTRHPGAQWTDQRRVHVLARLREEPGDLGAKVAGLELAIEGALVDPLHNGSETGRTYLEFENVFVHRGRDRIEKLQGAARRPAPPPRAGRPTVGEQNMAVAARFVARHGGGGEGGGGER